MKFEASDFKRANNELPNSEREWIARKANFLLEQWLKAATTECDACGKTVLNEKVVE